MQRTRFPRTVTGLVAAQMLMSACTATAGSTSLWPEPAPSDPPPQQQRIVRMTPDFRAPSATHCSRPVTTREVPGRTQSEPDALRSDDAPRGSLAKVAPSAAPPAGIVPPAPASAIAPHFAEGRARSEDSARTFAPPMPQSAPMQQRPVEPVTVGMVDDNADFTSYLAFRARTRVEHRPRDVRERYLLEVKDGRGRGVADAEVAVQSPNVYAMWARTDAGGRAWLHPDAFDPSHAATYDVAVRKDGREAWTRLSRGQKSAVEVRIDAARPRAARLDLVFLVDATGSMGDEIDKLKASLRTIVREVSSLPSHPDLCLGMVAYRDHGDAFITRTHDFTNDAGDFLRSALMPLQATGGGDYPEAMNEALHETVHNLSWRGDGATRLVVLLADAPPHLDYGAPNYDDDMLAALGKGIKVFSVGASGLDRQGEYIQRQIAQYTGGKFVFLTYANANDPSSGPGRETVHDVKNYSVETLDRLIVRLVSEELGKLGAPG